MSKNTRHTLCHMTPSASSSTHCSCRKHASPESQSQQDTTPKASPKPAPKPARIGTVIDTVIVAVIIAAGQGHRMGLGFGHENGHPKPCMPLGNSTILANVMKCLQAGVTGPIVVVTGYHEQAVTAEAQRLGLYTAHNPHPERGMLSSMQTGFAALLKLTGPQKLDGVLLLPADIPTVRPATCALLAQDFHENRAAITYPTFQTSSALQGERGHPPILARHVVEQALTYDGQGGLRGLLMDLEVKGAHIRNVPVADEGILVDMDTPADHQLITSHYAMRHIPTPRERESLLAMAETPSHTQAHCAMVARAALVMAVHLDATDKGYVSAFRVDSEGNNTTFTDRESLEKQNLTSYEKLKSEKPLYDRPLIHAAGMLHDICKGSRRHEQAGGDFLRRHGFAEIADIVAAHRDVNSLNPEALTPSHLVMLADKYIRGDRLVPIEERYDERLRQWASQPDVVRDIQGRKDRAVALSRAFERAACVELYPLLQRKLKGLAC